MYNQTGNPALNKRSGLPYMISVNVYFRLTHVFFWYDILVYIQAADWTPGF